MSVFPQCRNRGHHYRRPITTAALLFLLWASCASAGQTPIIEAFAGTGDSGFSGDRGPSTLAQFNVLESIASDGLGGLYIVDAGNFRIRKVSKSGVITTVAGTGKAGSPKEGLASRSPVLQVYDIAAKAAGVLYMGSSDGIQTVDLSGNLRYVFRREGAHHLAITPQNAIFLADDTSVSRLESNGSVTLIAGSEAGDSGDGGPASSAMFSVTGLAADRLGNLYVLDNKANRVRKLSPGGAITTIAGTGAADFRGDGGPATQAAFNTPSGIAVDIAGNVYISDSANHRIRKVATNGIVTTLAGQDHSTNPGDGGPAIRAYIDYPTHLGVSCNALYVVDGDRIRAIGLVTPLIAQDVTASKRQGDTFTISGCNLAQGAESADQSQPLPSVLGGVKVTLNGITVPLSLVGPAQITGKIPAGVQSGVAKLVVSNSNETATASIRVK